MYSWISNEAFGLNKTLWVMMEENIHTQEETHTHTHDAKEMVDLYHPYRL